jgi:hypothetical protein
MDLSLIYVNIYCVLYTLMIHKMILWEESKNPVERLYEI